MNKIKYKRTILVSLIIFCVVSSSILPYILADDPPPLDPPIIVDGDYLYLNDPAAGTYVFTAKEECYIFVKVKDIDFTEITLDGEILELSYGLNMFPKLFEQEFTNHELVIDPENSEFIQWIAIEPLFIAEGVLESLDQNTAIDVPFIAGGYITILLQPNFLYNWLYVELDNVVLKEVYDPADYPEMNSQLYSYYLEGGAYIRFDYNMEPGDHLLKLKGDGDLDYKILVNLDWDGDEIYDVEEVQQELFYDIDPTIPDVWGFFEKGEEINPLFEEDIYLEGSFSFYLPEVQMPPTLFIDVIYGEFKDFVIDGDILTFKNLIVESGYEDPPIELEYPQFLSKGWHNIEYLYKADLYNKISFKISDEEIKVIQIPEFIDSDGDGVKDGEEISSGLNRYNPDTDDDGLPDFYDPSPLNSIVLDKDLIHQIILPTHLDKDSMITLQVKKPANDYSTKGVNRLWRGAYNVTITPVLRLFGNKKEVGVSESGEILTVDMNRAELDATWNDPGENINLVFECDPAYEEGGLGDPLPNPSDPDGEFWIVYPKPSENSFEYDITFPKTHPAKLDGYLDLRFDFIWLITEYNQESGKSSVLHYYEFEENIIIQNMIKREVESMDYIIASPDSFIEHRILWLLIQNPDLRTHINAGTDLYGVADDIMGEGTVDYYKLGEEIMNDIEIYYDGNVNPDPENEVLYAAGMQNNYDILKEIMLSTIPDPSFAEIHQGDFDSFFSFNSISNVYQDDEIGIGDAEVQGDSKINYAITYYDYSDDQNTIIEQRAMIMELPISLEVESFPDSKVLKITQVMGREIPLNEIPTSLNQEIYDKITFHHQIYIEKDDLNEPIPTLHFNEEIDIYKELYNNRPEEVEKGSLLFSHYSPGLTDNFFKYYFDVEFNTDDITSKLYDNFIEGHFTSDKFDDYVGLVADFSEFFSESQEPGQPKEFLPELFQDDIKAEAKLKVIEKFHDKMKELQKLVNDPKKGKNLIDDMDDYKEEWDALIDELWNDDIKTRASTQNMYFEVMANMDDPCPKTKYIRLTRKRIKMIGAVAIAMGAVNLIFGTIEMLRLAADGAAGLFKDREAEYFMRMAGATCTTLMGGLTVIAGALLFIQALPKAAGKNFLKAVRFLGKAISVLAVLTYAFGIGTLIAQLNAGDISQEEFNFELGKIIIEIAFDIGIGLAIGAAISSTGWGIAAGLAVAGLSALAGWVASLFNHPRFDVITSSDPNSGTRLIIPDDTLHNMRRHGSLRVGDRIQFYIRAKNTGDRPAWFRSRFALVGGSDQSWSGRWGSSNYGKNSIHHNTFTSYIGTGTTDVRYRLRMQMDWEKFHIIVFVPWWTRETGFRYDETESLGLLAVESTILNFYAQTEELMNLAQLINKYQELEQEYKWKDMYYTASEIMARTQSQSKISYDLYNNIVSNKIDYDGTTYDEYTTSNFEEYLLLIETFYGNGFRAKQLSLTPTEQEIYDAEGDQKRFHLKVQSYDASGGAILIPKQWFEETDFAIYDEYKTKRDNLPLRTNIRMDLGIDIIDIDPLTRSADVDFDLKLESNSFEGDQSKMVEFRFETPSGFEILGDQIYSVTQPLSSEFSFTLDQIDYTLGIGIYYIDFKIFLDGNPNPVYEESIPFRIMGFSKVDMETYTPTEAIIPGFRD